jgi:hypothetical protein
MSGLYHRSRRESYFCLASDLLLGLASNHVEKNAQTPKGTSNCL